MAAIGRTLQGAGLDWHDLAKRVADPSYADVMPVAEEQRTSSWSRPPARPRKPRRSSGPPQWPTVSTLSREDRLAWMEAIVASPYSMERGTRAAFDAWYLAMRQGVDPDAEARTMINRLIRTCWERGWRPEEKAA